ncbi:cytochrome C oxidase subunit IV family protein [Halomonas litopenaei]|uniref:cytochrome C oxidase subunit IV family protein n=1 Tax=Halomonas litopenaei TaxID=2109328 RepID=UPI003F9EF9AF
MNDTDTQRRRLWRTWALLMAMTLVAMASGALHRGPLAPWALALVLIASLVKAQQILSIYLNLRIAPASWRGGLLVLVGVMGLGLAAAGLLPRWIEAPGASSSVTATPASIHDATTNITTDRRSDRRIDRHTERHIERQAQEPR